MLEEVEEDIGAILEEVDVRTEDSCPDWVVETPTMEEVQHLLEQICRIYGPRDVPFKGRIH